MSKNTKYTTLIYTITLIGISINHLSYSFTGPSKVWPENNHYYQDIGTTNWAGGNRRCNDRGGYLVTINSQAENDFIKNSLSSFGFWLGGSNLFNKGEFKWHNGEPFYYSNLDVSYNNLPPLDNYIQFLYFSRLFYGSGGIPGVWYSELGFGGYQDRIVTDVICEWNNGANYISISNVADLNGDGKSETAALYVNLINGVDIVDIRDPKTNALINSLTFDTDPMPLGMVIVADINNNDVPEIAVLYDGYVSIKDAIDNSISLRTIDFFDSNTEMQSITTSPDSNGNGFSEITVMGFDFVANKTKVQIKDSGTGELLREMVL